MRHAFLHDSPEFPLLPELQPCPSEAVLEKITQPCFLGTPLDIALRDCAINAFAIVGLALDVGIEPTVRHAADLGYIPVVVVDACDGRDEGARQRALAGLAFAGDDGITDTDTLCRALGGG